MPLRDRHFAPRRRRSAGQGLGTSLAEHGRKGTDIPTSTWTSSSSVPAVAAWPPRSPPPTLARPSSCWRSSSAPGATPRCPPARSPPPAPVSRARQASRTRRPLLADLLRQSGPHEAEQPAAGCRRDLGRPRRVAGRHPRDRLRADHRLQARRAHRPAPARPPVAEGQRPGRTTCSPPASAPTWRSLSATRSTGSSSRTGRPRRRRAGDRVEEYTLRCDAVVLAANGFAADTEMFARVGARARRARVLRCARLHRGGVGGASTSAPPAQRGRPSRATRRWPIPRLDPVVDDGREGRGHRRRHRAPVRRRVHRLLRFRRRGAHGQRPVVRRLRHARSAIALNEEEFAELVEMGGARVDTSTSWPGDRRRRRGARARPSRRTPRPREASSPTCTGRTDFGRAPLTALRGVARDARAVPHPGRLAVDDDGACSAPAARRPRAVRRRRRRGRRQRPAGRPRLLVRQRPAVRGRTRAGWPDGRSRKVAVTPLALGAWQAPLRAGRRARARRGPSTPHPSPGGPRADGRPGGDGAGSRAEVRALADAAVRIEPNAEATPVTGGAGSRVAAWSTRPRPTGTSSTRATGRPPATAGCTRCRRRWPRSRREAGPWASC